MKLWLLLFASFLGLFGAALYLWWRTDCTKRQKKMGDAIRAGAGPARTVVKAIVLVEPPAKTSGLAAFFRASSAEAAGNGDWSRGRLVVLTALAALAGMLAGLWLVGIIGASAPVIGACAGAALPAAVQRKKRRKRLARFEEQFPDALDFLSRSIRAGNAFSVALELLGTEAAEPLQTEIRKVTRELALGARFDDALNGLIARVPLVEIRFFVSAVLLQRETGGDLSEVIGKLANSLRERVRLRGHVKGASGQARLTAAILGVLPIVVLLLLKMASPSYMNSLTGTPMGRNLLAGAAVFQIVGRIVMKRIINIEV
jgi:tight adherence protein B